MVKSFHRKEDAEEGNCRHERCRTHLPQVPFHNQATLHDCRTPVAVKVKFPNSAAPNWGYKDLNFMGCQLLAGTGIFESLQ